MSEIEQQTRDAVCELAERAPEVDLWERTQRRISFRRRRARVAIASLAAVLLAASVANAFVAGDEPTRRVAVEKNESPAYPSRFVAVVSNGPIEVFDSWSGRQMRMLGGGGQTSRLSVTPDGQMVFFDSASARPPDGCPADAPKLTHTSWMATVTGQVQSFGIGTSPVVSPDGSMVAYATLGDAGRSCSYNALVIESTDTIVSRTGAETDLTIPRFQTSYSIDALSWSADSRAVVLSSYKGDTTVFDLERAIPETVAVPVSAGGLLSYYGTQELVGTTAREGDLWYAVWDATTGELTRTLFPSPCSGVASATSPPPPVVSDHSILLLCADGGYRWTEGDAAPTRIGGPYRAAAWIP